MDPWSAFANKGERRSRRPHSLLCPWWNTHTSKERDRLEGVREKKDHVYQSPPKHKWNCLGLGRWFLKEKKKELSRSYLSFWDWCYTGLIQCLTSVKEGQSAAEKNDQNTNLDLFFSLYPHFPFSPLPPSLSPVCDRFCRLNSRKQRVDKGQAFDGHHGLSGEPIVGQIATPPVTADGNSCGPLCSVSLLMNGRTLHCQWGK